MAADEVRLKVMGSDATVVVVDPFPGACAAATARLVELEHRWSRFLDHSELSRANRAAGSWIHVSSDTLTLVLTMQEANVVTGGAYDPTFLHEVLRAGYTASLDDPRRVSVTVDLPSIGLSVHDVVVDRDSGALFLPEGLALDPGGIGKGLAADLVAAELLDSGAAGALVSVGGDLRAVGNAPTADGWPVDVMDPLDPTRVRTRFVVDGGGVATSSTVARRSVVDGVSRHHTIDPRTRESAASDLAAITVVAPTGWLAEAHATAALLAGVGGARAHLEAVGLSGFGVGLDGLELRTRGLGRSEPADAVSGGGGA